jgi:hypothetical protein
MAVMIGADTVSSTPWNGGEVARPQGVSEGGYSSARPIFYTHASSQAQEPSPGGAEVHPRAAAMAEAIREIVFRDGCVTECALIEVGFTPAEITAMGAQASAAARARMVSEGTAPDDLKAIVAKACDAAPILPAPGGFVADRRAVDQWRRYRDARAAHAVDPWIGQETRSVEILRAFLVRLPLLPREVNYVITHVVARLKAIEAAREVRGPEVRS